MNVKAGNRSQILEASVLVQPLANLLPADVIIKSAHLRLDFSFARQT
jgi:hypothetical protein